MLMLVMTGGEFSPSFSIFHPFLMSNTRPQMSVGALSADMRSCIGGIHPVQKGSRSPNILQSGSRILLCLLRGYSLLEE